MALLREPTAANITDKRPCASMCTLVRGQIALLREPTPANITDVRSYTGVSTHVIDQVMFQNEARPTICTAVRSYATVNAFVIGQIVFQCKACRTARMVTCIQFLRCVAALMPTQSASLREARITARVVADEWPLA